MHTLKYINEITTEISTVNVDNLFVDEFMKTIHFKTNKKEKQNRNQRQLDR